jgi:hypothetical protein
MLYESRRGHSIDQAFSQVSSGQALAHGPALARWMIDPFYEQTEDPGRDEPKFCRSGMPTLQPPSR